MAKKNEPFNPFHGHDPRKKPLKVAGRGWLGHWHDGSSSTIKIMADAHTYKVDENIYGDNYSKIYCLRFWREIIKYFDENNWEINICRPVLLKMATHDIIEMGYFFALVNTETIFPNIQKNHNEVWDFLSLNGKRGDSDPGANLGGRGNISFSEAGLQARLDNVEFLV